MRFDYKIIPLKQPHPVYAGKTSVWMPILPVRLSVGHNKQTPRIEALIDSGASETLADIGKLLGLNVEAGIPNNIGGIVPGHQIKAFFHDVNFWVGTGVIRIKAGFAEEMSVGAILGRHGFFEHFIVTFDPSAEPPGFDITRLPKV